ncbi:MAG: hypothetical protein ACI865_002078 [Flavobacteriaceae bacterium]|jgi:hypothetical protein
MKNILLILAIAFSSTSFAQGNLQFNQVINDEIIGLIGTSTLVIGSVTVPAGKVWKIEAVSLITAPSGNSLAPSGTGYLVFFDNLCIINGNTMRQVPIWLSAGIYSVRARSSSSQNYSFSYSAIEFNVVP